MRRGASDRSVESEVVVLFFVPFEMCEWPPRLIAATAEGIPIEFGRAPAPLRSSSPQHSRRAFCLDGRTGGQTQLITIFRVAPASPSVWALRRRRQSASQCSSFAAAVAAAEEEVRLRNAEAEEEAMSRSLARSIDSVASVECENVCFFVSLCQVFPDCRRAKTDYHGNGAACCGNYRDVQITKLFRVSRSIS